MINKRAKKLVKLLLCCELFCPATEYNTIICRFWKNTFIFFFFFTNKLGKMSSFSIWNLWAHVHVFTDDWWPYVSGGRDQRPRPSPQNSNNTHHKHKPQTNGSLPSLCCYFYRYALSLRWWCCDMCNRQLLYSPRLPSTEYIVGTRTLLHWQRVEWLATIFLLLLWSDLVTPINTIRSRSLQWK